MRPSYWLIPGVLICAAAALASQTGPVTGPVLGFVFDHSVGGVRPILGIPGASLFGEPVGLRIDTSRAAISNAGGYVLGTEAETGRVMLYRELAPAAPGIALEEAGPAPDRIVLSPTGSAAALLYAERQAIQVFAGLPASPQFRGEISLFGLLGPLLAIAVADDGRSVLAAAREGEGAESVMLLSPGMTPRLLGTAGRVAAAAFFAGRPDAVLADTSAEAVVWIRDVQGAAEFVSLHGEFAKAAAVQATEDGRKILVAGEGTVTTVNLEGGEQVVSRCECSISALDRLRGDSVFRVTELSAGPTWLFDAGSPAARFVFVPARATAFARGISAERLVPRPTAPAKGGTR
ncbi:MAG: hypothetical protein ACM3S5_03545 [Rhodospirillales bacterium]